MRRSLITVLLVLALLTPSAHAWNVAGHEIAAAEAYDILAKSHPETIKHALTLLKQHPLYDKMFCQQAGGGAGEITQLYADEKTVYRQPAAACAWGQRAGGGAKQPEATLSCRSNTKCRLAGALDAASGLG